MTGGSFGILPAKTPSAAGNQPENAQDGEHNDDKTLTGLLSQEGLQEF